MRNRQSAFEKALKSNPKRPLNSKVMAYTSIPTSAALLFFEKVGDFFLCWVRKTFTVFFARPAFWGLGCHKQNARKLLIQGDTSFVESMAQCTERQTFSQKSVGRAEPAVVFKFFHVQIGTCIDCSDLLLVAAH